MIVRILNTESLPQAGPDFPKIPQRGIDVQAAVITLWNPTAQTWQLVSKPTGIPLDR